MRLEEINLKGFNMEGLNISLLIEKAEELIYDGMMENGREGKSRFRL